MDPIADMLTSIRNAQAARKETVSVPYSKIKKIRQGFGSQILSTPKGILSGKEARREKIGGEVICEVY